MIIKPTLTILTILVLSITAARTRSERESRQSSRSAFGSIDSVYRVDCGDDGADIQTALQRLSSGEYTQVEQGRNTILSQAKRSSGCRQKVVRALMESMDKPDLNFERELSNYFIWREGSQLLGELKAIEALDLLISHLDMTSGLHSASMVFQPAILGVRQMGSAAIPKLTVALQQSSKPSVRMAAAYCLTDIGGVSAMNTLRHAQNDEANECVARFITISLNTFTYKLKGRISFDKEAPQATIDARRKWLMAFQCVE